MCCNNYVFQVGPKHLEWHKMKMKVKLAAQLLSRSVADALEYLKGLDERFTGSGPTIKFIRIVS